MQVESVCLTVRLTFLRLVPQQLTSFSFFVLVAVLMAFFFVFLLFGHTSLLCVESYLFNLRGMYGIL